MYTFAINSFDCLKCSSRVVSLDDNLLISEAQIMEATNCMQANTAVAASQIIILLLLGLQIEAREALCPQIERAGLGPGDLLHHLHLPSLAAGEADFTEVGPGAML